MIYTFEINKIYIATIEYIIHMDESQVFGYYSSVNVCTHTHIHTRTHTYTHVHTHTHTAAAAHTTHVRTTSHTHTQVHVSENVF